MSNLKLGITTFAEVMPDPKTGQTLPYATRLNNLLEEIVLADQVGLDYFGVGEHHRHDFAASSPATILAAAAPLTKQIQLGSAVSVLSSDDPVRLYQQFSTLQALSHGRAEIAAGRGSFIESFPLFGYDLKDYDALFEEKLTLLLDINAHEKVTFYGRHRAPIENLGVYPRSQPIPIHVAVGGTPSSVVRAARLGLPLFLAIIGGQVSRYRPLVDLYIKEYRLAGHDEASMMISVHSHGYVADTMEEALDTYYPSVHQAMDKIGKERGFGTYTKATYDAMNLMDGALYVGDPAYVIKKLEHLKKALGTVHRFAMHTPVGYLDHARVLDSIRLLGEAVKPYV